MNTIEITLISPVCIARKRGVGNVIETLDYIPGSTIRGALAMRYLKQPGNSNQMCRRWELPDTQKQTEFNHLFLSDQVMFGNAYIRGCRVLPMTAMTCKYEGGFRSQKGHGVFDAALPFAKYELKGELDDQLESCPECGANMDRFGGYYERTGTTNFKKEEVKKRVIARTAITSSLETALRGSLYTLDVLNEKQSFRAEIRAEDEAINLLKGLIAKPNEHLQIGTAKTRALGEIAIKIWKTQDRFSARSVKERLDGLNKEAANFTSDRTLFTVTPHSDVILLDEILRYKTSIELVDLREAIAHYTPMDFSILDRFEPLRSWLSIHRVTGWDIAKKRPKVDEIAITKGSVLVFISKKGQNLTNSEINTLADVLEKIENVGIGERRNEGFGCIRICDEFHWEVPKK